MFLNTTTQQKPSQPPQTRTSYFSKICSLVTWKSSSSSLSSTSSSTIQQQQQDSEEDTYDDVEKDYYFVKHAIPNSVQATLTLINKLNVVFSQDLLNEFQIIKDNLVVTCHQFDKYKVVDQFTNTDQKIGVELRLYIQFMTDRYAKSSSWLALMGLLMIGIQVLKTCGEVKTQLIYQTKIGRDLILAMQENLVKRRSKRENGRLLPKQLESGISKIALEGSASSSEDIDGSEEREGGRDDWFSALKNVCFQFADYDSDWVSREKYYQVVSLATQLLLDQEEEDL